MGSFAVSYFITARFFVNIFAFGTQDFGKGKSGSRNPGTAGRIGLNSRMLTLLFGDPAGRSAFSGNHSTNFYPFQSIQNHAPAKGCGVFLCQNIFSNSFQKPLIFQFKGSKRGSNFPAQNPGPCLHILCPFQLLPILYRHGGEGLFHLL